MASYKNGKLADVAASRIRDMIIHGVLSSGEPLAEVRLAEELGMSRTPIREAISILEFEGMVHSITGRGAVVTDIAKEDFIEINDIRVALEPLAAARAMPMMPRNVISEYKTVWMKFLEDMRTGHSVSSHALTEEDEKLHRLFIDYCGSRRLKNILSSLRHQARRYIFVHWDTKEYVVETIIQHLDIVRAAEIPDSDLLKSSLETHLLSNKIFLKIYKT
ncbi:MAG: GntR family transcriptional regulator [Synergistaceae bacterium]|jgi:DNA-binding GntR family transcriptional regulator|nr:GntR family transcriptional regulator [Synergistaceae bacterium]